MELTPLTEQELNYYVSLAPEDENKKRINLLDDKFKEIDDKLKTIHELKEKIKENLKEEEYKKAEEDVKRLVKLTETVACKARDIPFYVGINIKDKSILSTSSELVKLSINDDILKIELDTLLPSVDSKSKNFIRDLCSGSFQEFFKNGKFKVYDEKVIICFFNYYDNQTNFRDNDNIDVSTLINLLNIYVLHDDNPFWCDMYVKSLSGDYNHTEVYVVPESKFINFVNKKAPQ